MPNSLLFKHSVFILVIYKTDIFKHISFPTHQPKTADDTRLMMGENEHNGTHSESSPATVAKSMPASLLALTRRVSFYSLTFLFSSGFTVPAAFLIARPIISAVGNLPISTDSFEFTNPSSTGPILAQADSNNRIIGIIASLMCIIIMLHSVVS